MFKAIGMFVTFCFVGIVALVVFSPGFQEGFKKGFDQSYRSSSLVGKGQKVSYGNFNVYYDDGVGKELATKVKDNMVDFTKVKIDDEQKDVFVVKDHNTYQIKISMREGVPLDAKMKAAFGYLAHKLSDEVFDGAATETHVCGPNMVTEEIIFPIGEIELLKQMAIN